MNDIQIGLMHGFDYELLHESGGVAEAYQQLILGAKQAEEYGFNYYFMTEHQGNDNAMFSSPAEWLAVISQHTQMMRLGTMIFQLPFYNPIRLAQDAALVDQLSMGRLEFGIGYGVWEHEFVRWNLPFAERRAMGAEALEIIKKAWTEESFTYSGKYWQFDEALPWPQPFQRPHPPLWAACSSQETFENAAKMNYHIAQALDHDDVIAEKHRMWERMWAEAGHEGPKPHSILDRRVYVAETDKQAIDDIGHLLDQAASQSFLAGGPRVSKTRIGFMSGNTEDTPQRRQRRGLYQRLADEGASAWIESGMAIVGSPETVARRIAETQEQIGYDVFLAGFRFAKIPGQLVDKSFKLFGEKVIPALSQSLATSSSG